MSEPRDPPLSKATRDELVKALKDSLFNDPDMSVDEVDGWLVDAFDIEADDDDFDEPAQFHEDDIAAIRDAYESVAKNASETHTRNFYEAFRGRIDLLSPATIRRLR